MKLISLLALFFSAVPLFAQSSGEINLSWFKIAGGGNASVHGDIQLISTIGQSDAHNAINNGNLVIKGGFIFSPSDLMVENLPPVAPDQNFIRQTGLTLEIAITELLAGCSDPDGRILTLNTVGASVQGASISLTATHILYALAANTDDNFAYTISDGQGGTTTGMITVQAVSPGGVVQTINTSGGSVTLNIVGIPGFTYDIQRATNIVGAWNIVDTQTAPANGLFSYADPTPPLPIAFYRLQQSVAEGERLDAGQSIR